MPLATDVDLHQHLSEYIERLHSLEVNGTHYSVTELDEEITLATEKLIACCRVTGSALDNDRLRDSKNAVISATDRFWRKSWFGLRARDWPRGHQGDYETIDAFYQGVPRSTTLLGRSIDRYILRTQLGYAIRERLVHMAQLLTELLANSSKSLEILNVACGPCREIAMLSAESFNTCTSYTCLDFDPDALEYSQQHLSCRGLDPSKLIFIKMNVLNLIKPANELSDKYYDVIYSIGLFDYLPDKILERLISTLWSHVNPGGQLILAFKDIEHYDNTVYRWLANWDGFFPRTRAKINHLVTSVLSESAIQQEEVAGGIMLYLTAHKPDH